MNVKMVKKVYRYATGQDIPEGAIYLSTVKNGIMPNSDGNYLRKDEYCYVWHYFLVEVDE